MGKFIRGLISRTKKMGKEYLFGPTVNPIKVSGRMENSTELDCSLTPKRTSKEKEYGKTDSELNGQTKSYP